MGTVAERILTYFLFMQKTAAEAFLYC